MANDGYLLCGIIRLKAYIGFPFFRTEKMKICQIVASSGAGGLEKHVKDLCNKLSKSEDVTLIAPIGMQDGIEESVRFLPVDFSRSRHNPFLLWDLFKLLRSGNYDIIHAQANKAASVVTLLRKFLSVNLVGTIHNSSRNKGNVFKSMDHVIAVSEEAGERVSEHVPVSVIYNGIRPHSRSAGYTRLQLIEEFKLDGLRPLLCSIGRLVDAKGFDVLIDALQSVDVNMLIIGEGQLKANLQTQIQKHNLQNRIKLTGHRNDIQEILSGVDGMVISSRNEGFSYVFVEALLSKTPVLATDISAKEFLPETLIMKKSVDSIRDKISEYAFSPVKWEQEMLPVFNRAEQELTLEAMVHRTLSVYKKILKVV